MSLNLPFKYIYQIGLNEDLEQTLVDTFNIDPLDLEDVYTETQLAKIEHRPNYLYIFLQLPQYQKVSRSFTEKEFHYFLNDQNLFVIDKNNSQQLVAFNRLIENNNAVHDTPFSLFYEMFDFCITDTFRVLSKFKIEIHALEKKLYDPDTNVDLVLEIQIIKRNLINYLSIISPLREMVLDLQKRYTRLNDKDGFEKLDDTLDKIKKIINMAQTFKEQLYMLSETNESLTARSTNQAIRTLTSISMIILIPNIITSFFGMNVFFGWPIEANLWPLGGITVIILVTVMITFWIMKKYDWL